jgi:hypothetical protein
MKISHTTNLGEIENLLVGEATLSKHGMDLVTIV